MQGNERRAQLGGNRIYAINGIIITLNLEQYIYICVRMKLVFGMIEGKGVYSGDKDKKILPFLMGDADFRSVMVGKLLFLFIFI